MKEIIEYTSIVDTENKNSFNQLHENDKVNQDIVTKLEAIISDNDLNE